MDTMAEPSAELVEEFVIAAHGNLEKVRTLLAATPALLNIPWARFDETALAAASHMGNRAIAEHLLAAGAPLTVCTAAMLGDTEQVAAFLDADPTLANATGAHGIPILFHAAMSGNLDVVELLVARGGGAGPDGALHGAVGHGHLAMTRWLLARGADPNTLDFAGKTTLRVALDRGYAEMAGLLRAHGGLEAAPADAA
jgi:ankyrin repeat protein